MSVKIPKMSTGVVELKEKFKEVRDRLKEKGAITVTLFEDFVIMNDKDWDTKEGLTKIHDVYYGRTSSLSLFFMIEAYEQKINS